MAKKAIAIGCHPDDIEFMMAGTLLKLQKAGYEIHYMNVANGALGTNQYDFDAIIKLRREEAMAAAASIGAVYHESVCNDLEVFYNLESIAGVLKVVREVEPEIVLTHGPYDYMEDHTCTGRLAVTAAFCRGMQNFKGVNTPITEQDVAVYHSMPHSITDSLRRPVEPGLFVNIDGEVETKKAMLACHKSQKEWLDASQGIDAYLVEMEKRSAYYGRLSKRYAYAEGWIRHNPIGFCPDNFNPLVNILGDDAFINEEFESKCSDVKL